MISCVLLLLLFAVTGFAARSYHGEERRLASRWFARGQAAMAANRAEEAIQDFRIALVYSRENGENSTRNTEYDVSLARALAASGRLNEARTYLLGLADRGPCDSAVNLELARLAALQNNSAKTPQ